MDQVMPFLDAVRYWISVLFVISVPPAVGWWFLVHPLVGFWRRLGAKAALSILTLHYGISILGLLLVKDPLVGHDLGPRWLPFLAGLPLWGIAIAIALARKKHLTFRILAGVPEIEHGERESRLLQEGIYGRIRHPRYLEFILGGSGWALLLDYSGVYLVMVFSIVAILAIVPLEERELRQRFGTAYADYAARVPRFLPRIRGRTRQY